MTLTVATQIEEARCGRGEDRIAVADFPGRKLVVVADGAGGVTGGADAAEALCRALTGDVAGWTTWLAQQDAALAAKSTGLAAAVVFSISDDGVIRGWQSLMGNDPTPGTAATTWPVVNVSWFEAASYLNALSASEELPECYTLSGCTGTAGIALECGDAAFAGLDCGGYRLPTEAEWEHAARAGTTLGNVFERVHDWRAPYPSAPTVDPTGPDAGTDRVLRGGALNAGADLCLAAERRIGVGMGRGWNIGFRPARTAP